MELEQIKQYLNNCNKLSFDNNLKSQLKELNQKDNLSSNLLKNIINADIILLPYEDFKGFKNCFPKQTYQFYSFLKE